MRLVPRILALQHAHSPGKEMFDIVENKGFLFLFESNNKLKEKLLKVFLLLSFEKNHWEKRFILPKIPMFERKKQSQSQYQVGNTD